MKFTKIGIIGNPTKPGASKVISQVLKKYGESSKIQLYINNGMAPRLGKKLKTYTQEYVEAP